MEPLVSQLVACSGLHAAPVVPRAVLTSGKGGVCVRYFLPAHGECLLRSTRKNGFFSETLAE